MERKVEVDSNNWFVLDDYSDEIGDKRFIVLTGARGCGKTYSLAERGKRYFIDGKVGLYIRNTKEDLSTARQYFSYLEDQTHIINLGSLGANTVVLENKEEKNDKRLVAYTLFIADYETCKSSGRLIDYVIYEEFSSFKTGIRINRIFALTELIESISQRRPNFMFYGVSNNIFKDDLFNNLLNDDAFIHYQIIRDVVKNGITNSMIRAYLTGEYLVPEIEISLGKYVCLGEVSVGGGSVYIYYNEKSLPQYVISSTGTGKRLKINTDVIGWLSNASYRNLSDRNKCEFIVGLLQFSGQKLRA